MKETLEKLWNEYLLDECAPIDTDEERNLTQKTAELYEKASTLLNKEQKTAVQKYVDSLCDIDALFVRKAFLKGCEFAVSFLLEAGNLRKQIFIYLIKSDLQKKRTESVKSILCPFCVGG